MIAHLDCPTGIAGDMFLGALLDAGLPEESLREAIGALGVSPDSLEVSHVSTYGISATSVRVVDSDPAGHTHRAWSEIREMLEGAGLPAGVAVRAIATFEALARAEGEIHGCDPGRVSFHEVGAIDSVVDIVGVSLGLEVLGIENLTCSSLVLGSGVVSSQHGPLPVPAPATIALLRDVPVHGGTVAGELTTPTGAALVVTNASAIGVALPPMKPRLVGYGAGTRDIGIPNAARLILGEPSQEAADGATVESVIVLETNIDHVTPEALGSVTALLLERGALDVWQTPIAMKKGRVAVSLSVMCVPADAEAMAGHVLRETGSLGVRRTDTMRYVARREARTIDTPFGPVAVKVSEVEGVRRARPEHDEVERIADETGLPFDIVAARIARVLSGDTPAP